MTHTLPLTLSPLLLPMIPKTPISTITVDKVSPHRSILNENILLRLSLFAYTVNFILQQYKDAEADYNKSVTLDPDFVFSHIQLAVAQYKLEQVAPSMATFRRTMKAFPHKSEPQNY